MIEIIQKNTIRFFVLLFLQVLILNNIQLGGYINPYVYVLFILLLPFETPGWLMIILGFLMGFFIDVFSNTLGIHAAATVMMALARHYLLRQKAPRSGFDKKASPSIHSFGRFWFIKYSVFLIAIHHVFLFYMEVFSFNFFFTTLFRACLNIFITSIIVFLSQYSVYKK